LTSKRYLVDRVKDRQRNRAPSPAPYDERRILFDFNQEAREAASVEQLYQTTAAKISEALETADAALLVRDETSGDYVCRFSTTRTEVLRLACDAFVVKRLRHLSEPLLLEAADFAAWARGLDATARAAR
jgi:hypothetical protein